MLGFVETFVSVIMYYHIIKPETIGRVYMYGLYVLWSPVIAICM